MKTDRSKFNQSHPVWSRAGAGVWIRTSDNNLIVACRGGNVAEVPGQISYSSSGGCDRWIQRGETLINSTPSVNLAKEIHEELGINIKAEDLKWISFGIDLSGPWMQFSYYTETELDSEAVKEARKTAKDNHEFKMIFIPFEREAISVLLRRTKMEAGAAYSLYELCKKYGYHL